MASTARIHSATSRQLRFHRAMWVGMVVLCIIGAAAVIRRITALAHPVASAPAELVQLDEAFAKRPLLTLAHIAPALLLVMLVPFQFSPSFRNRHLQAHRWIGRTVMVLGPIIGGSALGLLRNPIGGRLEVSCILFFDAFFLFALTKALLHIRRREIAAHREWIIRAMSVALGVATVRPIMGIFFATSKLTKLTPHDFFGIAFWTGLSLTYIAAEIWIRYTRVTGTTALPPRPG